jgi:hypothetical protein
MALEVSRSIRSLLKKAVDARAAVLPAVITVSLSAAYAKL